MTQRAFRVCLEMRYVICASLMRWQAQTETTLRRVPIILSPAQKSGSRKADTACPVGSSTEMTLPGIDALATEVLVADPGRWDVRDKRARGQETMQHIYFRAGGWGYVSIYPIAPVYA